MAGRELQRAWQEVVDGGFEEPELRHLLVAGWQDLTPGTLCSALGRRLAVEGEGGCAARSPLDLDEVGALPTVRRIDGLMDIDIPRAGPIEAWISRWLADLAVLGLDMPPPPGRETLEGELALGLLGLLHTRVLRVSYGIEVPMRGECPSSPLGGDRPEIFLMGLLPNGRRVTLFTSRLHGDRHLAFPRHDLEHAGPVEACRDGSGRLLLRASA